MDLRIPTLLRIKPGALNKTGTYLRSLSFKTAALFYSPGMRELNGSALSASLADAGINVVHDVIRDTNIIEDVFAEMKILVPSCDVLLAIGGGKVIDYVKYLSLISAIPMVSIPTSVSNDGFSSPLSSLMVNSARKSVKSAMPVAVIIDIAIVAASPEKLLYSGIGDMSAKYTAIEDWRLAFYEKGLAINDFAKVMSLNAVNALAALPIQDIRNHDFIYNLASGLLISGIAIQIAGNTRPASGGEHLISHAYDTCAKSPSIHGIQVGVATLAISFFYPQVHKKVKRLLEASGFLDFVRKNPLSLEDFISAIENAEKVKPGFYSILSVPGVKEKLIKIASSNSMMRTLLV